MDIKLLDVIVTAWLTLSIAASSVWQYEHGKYKLAIYNAALSGMLLMGFFYELGKLINK